MTSLLPELFGIPAIVALVYLFRVSLRPSRKLERPSEEPDETVPEPVVVSSSDEEDEAARQRLDQKFRADYRKALERGLQGAQSMGDVEQIRLYKHALGEE